MVTGTTVGQASRESVAEWGSGPAWEDGDDADRDGGRALRRAGRPGASTSIPDELAALVHNVVVLVEDEPPEDEPDDLLGLYDGRRADRARQHDAAGQLPDRIFVFRGPLLDFCDDRGRSWSRRSGSPSCTRSPTTSASTTTACTTSATPEPPRRPASVAQPRRRPARPAAWPRRTPPRADATPRRWVCTANDE